MRSEPFDVIVIGGGVAGLSAALMLGRARRRLLVIDSGSPRNRFAAHMHGVLGHEGAPPGELIERGREEVASYGGEFLAGEVESVAEVDRGVSLTLRGGETVTARAVVVATGITDELPAIEGIEERWGVSVLHCPYCHGWEVRDRHLGVIARSPMSLHQAQLVRQWSDRVTVFTAALGPLEHEMEQRLRSRGIRLVVSPVVELFGDPEEPGALAGVRTADGDVVDLDAIFTFGIPRPLDSFLADLVLERTETPMGSFLSVDEAGKTSHDRIWAVGNVVDPRLNVPMSMGAGSLTGATVNWALVEEDFERVLRDPESWPETAPAEYWEYRYGSAEQMWSGKVNRVLADVASILPPGKALDLGCGEGGDAVWLAQHGWAATGIDISGTAVRRASEAARAAGLADEQARFVAADLSEFDGAEQFDLVSASFLHSTVTLPREAILRRAATLVAPGGHLLITSHAAPPPWAKGLHASREGEATEPVHEHRFPSPEEELAALRLDKAEWETVFAETREREATGPDGVEATLLDGVVLVRRRSGEAVV